MKIHYKEQRAIGGKGIFPRCPIGPTTHVDNSIEYHDFLCDNEYATLQNIEGSIPKRCYRELYFITVVIDVSLYYFCPFLPQGVEPRWLGLTIGIPVVMVSPRAYRFGTYYSGTTY